MKKPKAFWHWVTWRLKGKPLPRPADVPVKIPDEWWVWLENWVKKHKPKPLPPKPPSPPPAKPRKSWHLTNGPWIFVTSDPNMCRPGPWTRLDILENEIAPGAPLWMTDNGDVPQAEGGNQSKATIEWLDTRVLASSVAPVTTLGIDVAPYKARAIYSCFVECYLQEQPNALDKMWSAGQEGWEDPIPLVGVYHDFPLRAYKDWLVKYGKRFGVYTSDAMSDDDWKCLKEIVWQA